MDILTGKSKIDFMGLRWYAYVFSAILIGASLFTLMAVVVLLSFRAIFNKLDRGQREMDEELRKQGVR